MKAIKTQFYWWGKPEKTSNLPQVAEKLLSHNVVSSTPRLSGIWTHDVSGNRQLLVQLPYDHDHDGPKDTKAVWETFF
jgi:hypothetical protein